MRSFVAIALLLPFLVGFALCSLPQDRVARVEDELHYSMGIVRERRLFVFGDESCSNGISAPSVDLPIDPYDGEEVSIFTRQTGNAIFLFEKESADLSLSIAAKIPTEGEIDYRAFAFEDRLPVLLAPLTDEEIVYVFARIVSSATERAPIEGSLTEITFEKEEESLRAFARITLGLKGLIDKYRLVGLPEQAVFSVSMTFSLKNSYISVDFNKTSVCCETMDIPEAVLLFGCNLAFGRKDYKALFGNAVKNVFVNARIYR